MKREVKPHTVIAQKSAEESLLTPSVPVSLLPSIFAFGEEHRFTEMQHESLTMICRKPLAYPELHPHWAPTAGGGTIFAWNRLVRCVLALKAGLSSCLSVQRDNFNGESWLHSTISKAHKILTAFQYKICMLAEWKWISGEVATYSTPSTEKRNVIACQQVSYDSHLCVGIWYSTLPEGLTSVSLMVCPLCRNSWKSLQLLFVVWEDPCFLN